METQLVIRFSSIVPPAADSISRSYWVFHNFGDNAFFEELNSIEFLKIGPVPATSVPPQYRLFARPPRADGNTWEGLGNAVAVATGNDGSVFFSAGNGVEQAAQFIVARPMPTATNEQGKAQPQVSVSPNPVSSNGALSVKTNLVGKLKFRLYDKKGRAVRVAVFERETMLALDDLAAGAYFYSVEGEKAMRFGKVVVE